MIVLCSILHSAVTPCEMIYYPNIIYRTSVFNKSYKITDNKCVNRDTGVFFFMENCITSLTQCFGFQRLGSAASPYISVVIVWAVLCQTQCELNDVSTVFPGGPAVPRVLPWQQVSRVVIWSLLKRIVPMWAPRLRTANAQQTAANCIFTDETKAPN